MFLLQSLLSVPALTPLPKGLGAGSCRNLDRLKMLSVMVFYHLNRKQTRTLAVRCVSVFVCLFVFKIWAIFVG